MLGYNSRKLNKEAQPIIPEASQFVQEVTRRSRDEIILKHPYGHALVMTAVILREKAALGKAADEQRDFLKKRARWLVEKFGPEIITVMRDELRLQLTDEDFGTAK